MYTYSYSISNKGERSQYKTSPVSDGMYVLFGNHSSQLPRLIEKLPQWL
jgi:hypothetical protein